MKRFPKGALILIFIIMTLLGCQTQGDNNSANKIKLENDLKEINIFQSSEFKKEKANLIVSASDTENTEIFETVKTVINKARKQDGIVDMIEPNYHLEVVYDDDSSKELYLWLMEAEGGKGSLMEVEDTHIVYNFSKELNAKLTDLIITKE